MGVAIAGLSTEIRWKSARSGAKIDGMNLHEHHADLDHHGAEPGDMQLRVRALETILTEKGYVDPKALDLIIDAYENRIGPHIGARIIARAWSDAEFKHRLFQDATAAVATLGVAERATHLIAVENTAQRHNMVVCTLCSCYPWEVLGLPPVWYKSAAYRSRAVIDPARVLAECGVVLPPDTEIRVWDFDRRDPLSRGADAASRHRRVDRGEACDTRHPRLDDRHRARPTGRSW